MRQNLGWAIGYNAIALPIAAGVFDPIFGLVLRPEIAALSMSGSSFIVAVNAVMLKRLNLPRAPVGEAEPRRRLPLKHMARQSGLNASRDDWAHFARWCVAGGETVIPATPAAVVDYIQHLEASNEAATVPRRVAAIRDWHRASGLQAPTEDDRGPAPLHACGVAPATGAHAHRAARRHRARHNPRCDSRQPDRTARPRCSSSGTPPVCVPPSSFPSTSRISGSSKTGWPRA